jgi:hypothetical protein
MRKLCVCVFFFFLNLAVIVQPEAAARNVAHIVAFECLSMCLCSVHLAESRTADCIAERARHSLPGLPGTADLR